MIKLTDAQVLAAAATDRRSKICAPSLNAPTRKEPDVMAGVATTGKFHSEAAMAPCGLPMM